MDTQTVILTIIGAVFASQGFWTWLQTRNSKRSAKTKLIMGLGYAEICRRAAIYLAQGEITRDEYQDFVKYLYKPYRDMGGNGTADRLMREVEKLPIQKEAITK